MPAYHRGRICLIGDASTFARPHTGAGAVKAMTDAIALSKALATRQSVDAALPSLGVSSVSELITLAKAQPGRLSYGTIGIGSSPHFAGALLAKQASIETVGVHYKGNNEALLDLLAGRIQFAFDYLLTSIPHIRAGRCARSW